MDRLCFEAQDTLFFRDGRPFNQGEGNDGIESHFPPSPMTLVGAARAAWAKELGWKGKKRWLDEIKTDLGGDGEELKDLKFSGPMLYLNDEPLYPMPALLMGKRWDPEKPDKIVRLRPATIPYHCDLGTVHLPTPDVEENDPVEGRKLLGGWWLTQKGFASVISGGIPAADDLKTSGELWALEPKVGNQIDVDSGIVIEGMLYSTQHVRTREGVQLIMGIDGATEEFPPLSQVPLGGEARSCWLSKKPGGLGLPEASVIITNGVLRYAVFVLTPLNPHRPPKAGQSFEGLPGKVFSACLLRAQKCGGWDTIKREPLAMKPHLAPGSVIFMEAEETDEQQVLARHAQNIGLRGSWGFGLIAIGQWK